MRDLSVQNSFFSWCCLLIAMKIWSQRENTTTRLWKSLDFFFSCLTFLFFLNIRECCSSWSELGKFCSSWTISTYSSLKKKLSLKDQLQLYWRKWEKYLVMTRLSLHCSSNWEKINDDIFKTLNFENWIWTKEYFSWIIHLKSRLCLLSSLG